MAFQGSAESGDSGVSGCRSLEGEFRANSNSVEVISDHEWNNPKICDKEQNQNFEYSRHNVNLSDEQCKTGTSIEKSQKEEDALSKQTWDGDERFHSYISTDFTEELRNEEKVTLNYSLISSPRRLARSSKRQEDSVTTYSAQAELNSPCAELSPNVALPTAPYMVCDSSRLGHLGASKGVDGSHQILLDAFNNSTNKENLPASYLTMATNNYKKHLPTTEYTHFRQESIAMELSKNSTAQCDVPQQKQDLPSLAECFGASNVNTPPVNVHDRKSYQESQNQEMPHNNDPRLQSSLNNTTTVDDSDTTVLFIDTNTSNSSVMLVEKSSDQQELENSSTVNKEFVQREITDSILGIHSPEHTDCPVQRVPSRLFNVELERTIEGSETESKRQCNRLSNCTAYRNPSPSSFSQRPAYLPPSSLSPRPNSNQALRCHFCPQSVAFLASTPVKNSPPPPMLEASFIPSPALHVSIRTTPLTPMNKNTTAVASSPALEERLGEDDTTLSAEATNVTPRPPKRVVNGLLIIDETPKSGPNIPKRDGPLHPLLSDVPDEPVPGQQRVHLEDFEALKVLGSGAYGTVYLVKKITGRDRGKIYAMKVVKKSTVLHKKKNAEHAFTEREVFEAVRGYPFLSQMHYAFQDELCLYVVLDFLQGGEMFNMLNAKKKFSADEVRFYAGEMILAIEKLHALGIVYRDIKLENVMLDKDGHVVITDFGLSKKMVDLRTYSYCGTLEYMAPEIVENNGGGHDLMVDWWSLAVLMYELFFGESPFVRGNEKRENSYIAKRIIEGQYVFPEKISEDAEDLIRRLLTKDSKTRLGATRGAAELKEHPFFAPVNWKMLGNKRITPPCMHRFNDSLDLANFCDSFTSVPLSITASLPNTKFIWFKGFDYCAPEATVDSVVARALSSARIPQICDLITMKSARISKFFQNYDLDLTIPPVGKGSSALVFKCWSRCPRNVYAVKVMPRSIDCTHELSMLARAQKHEGILKLKELLFDDAFWYIVTEYVEGMDLHTYMKVADFLVCSEQSSRGIMRGVMMAVSHLHNRGLAHRDLKPENIALHLDGKPKIVDFGYACVVSSLANVPPNFTIGYAAPEVTNAAFRATTTGQKRKQLEDASEPASKRFRGPSFQTSTQPQEDPYDPRKADMWSIGVMLYLLLSGERLKESSDGNPSSHEIMIEKIRQGKFEFAEEGWRHVSATAFSLVTNLLSYDPSKRMSIDEALSHSWMTGVEETRRDPSEQRRADGDQSSPSSGNNPRIRRGRRRRLVPPQPQEPAAPQPEYEPPNILQDDRGFTASRPFLRIEPEDSSSRTNGQPMPQEGLVSQTYHLQAGMLSVPTTSQPCSNGTFLENSNVQSSLYEPIMTRARKRKQESPEYSQVAKVMRQMMLD